MQLKEVRPNPKSRPRIPVRRRGSGGFEIKEEGDQSWAVSYADMLMVLLSFFILFFSVGEEKKAGVIQQIAEATRSVSGYAVSPELSGKDLEHFDTKRILADLQDQKIVKTELNGERLIIYFADNLFNSGRTVLTPEASRQVRSTLLKMKPYIGQIQLTIVGHSDEVRIRRGFKPYIHSNIDLSAVRASRGVAIAQKIGFSPRHVFIKGTANFVRNTRSLTLVVEPKTQEQI